MKQILSILVIIPALISNVGMSTPITPSETYSDLNQQVVVGFERNISTGTDEETTLVLETYRPETEKQLEAAIKHIQSKALKALEDNPNLNVEFVHADIAEPNPIYIRPINEQASQHLEKAKQEFGEEIEVKESLVDTKEKQKMGFEKAMQNKRFLATKISLPQVPQAGMKRERTPEEKERRTNRVLTVVRAVTSLGINSFMIYSAIGAGIFSPVAIPALLFYPIAETALQLFSPQYEKLLKKSNFVLGRTGIQTMVSFAAVSTHVALLSLAGVTSFAWLSVVPTAFKDAIVTQSWWEMVVKGKPKFLTGEYVSFGLGVVGMTGLLLESTGMSLGSYILYGLGLTGSILWLKNGAIETLKNDVKNAKVLFKEKFGPQISKIADRCSMLSIKSNPAVFSN